MRKRRLKSDELELWSQVAKTAERLEKREFKPASEAPGTKKKPLPRVKEHTLPDLPRFRVGQKSKPSAVNLAMPKTVSEHLASAPVHMDKKAYGRMKRGKLVPEARIDLHGMTLDQAHPVLSRFILTSQARGLRLVLVITGKGQREDPHDPMPLRRGVLKRQVPMWLRTPPVALAVLQVTEAHLKHGGSGAYYVYLRRR